MKNLYNYCKQNCILLTFTVYCMLLYVTFLLTSQDNDMFFEIMSGRDLLNGNFSTATHLDNFPMIVQQWLYAVCLAIADKFGYIGHISLVFIQNVILMVVSSIFVYKKTNNIKLAIYGSFFSILYCHPYLINIRPQIITMILLVTELILLELYKEHDKKIKYLFLIILILVIAANFHQALFFYHIMLILPYYIDNTNKIYIDRKLVYSTPIFIACSLCTPYFIDGFLYIFRTFQSQTFYLININELKSLNITSFNGFKILILLALTIYYNYKHKSNIFINCYVFGISFLSFINIRHISVLYIAVLFILCNLDISKLKNITMYISFSIMIFISFIESGHKSINIFDNYGEVATIIENKDAKIYNSAIDLGGFLEYNGYTKVTVDSRIEVFSKEISGIDKINHNMYSVKHGLTLDKYFNQSIISDEDILTIVNDYDYIISTKADYINRISNPSNNWQEIFSDDKYNIYEKIE